MLKVSISLVMMLKLSFLGKTFKLLEEKDSGVGFEPGAKFLPSARFKSGNNLVL